MCIKSEKCVIAIITSIILGIITGALFFNGTIAITRITRVLIFALGVANLGELTLLATSKSEKNKYCVCKYGNCSLFAALGSIVVSIISIVLPIVAEVVGFSVLIGLLGFFFFLNLFSMLITLNCSIECRERCDCGYNE